MESWLLPKQATSPSSVVHMKVILRGYSTHLGTQNSPSSSLWICKDQPPKLHGTERIVTKTNAIAKSAENTSFCNYSSFLLSLSISLIINPFFSTELLFCSFSLVTFRATVSLIFPHTADVDFVLFSEGKIPSLGTPQLCKQLWLFTVLNRSHVHWKNLIFMTRVYSLI